jgi:uncharacterized membrane protein (DUF485 family)
MIIVFKNKHLVCKVCLVFGIVMAIGCAVAHWWILSGVFIIEAVILYWVYKVICKL